LPLSLLLHLSVLVVILSAAKDPETFSQTPTVRIFLPPRSLLRRPNRNNHATVFASSTEAAHSIIVSSAVEKSASLPNLFRSHDVVAVACFSLPMQQIVLIGNAIS
jgi:hypothetical protein